MTFLPRSPTLARMARRVVAQATCTPLRPLAGGTGRATWSRFSSTQRVAEVREGGLPTSPPSRLGHPITDPDLGAGLPGQQTPVSNVTKLELQVHTAEQTAHIARQLGVFVAPDATICLHGDLGAGKTEFARAFIKNRFWFVDDMTVPSPTYTLQQIYDPRVLANEALNDRNDYANTRATADPLYRQLTGDLPSSASPAALPYLGQAEPVVNHVDLYRLTNDGDIHALDLDELFHHSISLIEWPDRLPRLPEDRIDVHLMHPQDVPLNKRLPSQSTPSEGGRRIVFQGHGSDARAVQRLREALLGDDGVNTAIPRS
eukprot:TRINITY_DN42025_c0_g1_i1.p1 TRINITY_DN42025_c0_g1~~TRINITY_DN42025_c0_g1_i1.p1  ORF type:complete len:316 (-),score=51.58 TRINITY_DN42025_c0_g1_i1:208-1155(-)